MCGPSNHQPDDAEVLNSTVNIVIIHVYRLCSRSVHVVKAPELVGHVKLDQIHMNTKDVFVIMILMLIVNLETMFSRHICFYKVFKTAQRSLYLCRPLVAISSYTAL